MMDLTSQLAWHPQLLDPTGRRNRKPRMTGKTMVIDKGLGLHAFDDMLQTSGSHIDIIKIGFGTSPLYPQHVLRQKIELAKKSGVEIVPGGTFLEVAIRQDAITAYFEMIQMMGFSGIEVSDGTIEMKRSLRNQLISWAVKEGLHVCTEHGKKRWGSQFEVDEMLETIHLDIDFGAEFVILEGRESGVGVGIYDANGDCKEDELQELLKYIPNQKLIMWEAPHKQQQVHLMRLLGTDINLGNIAPQDVLSVEALRRGLRSDTLDLGEPASN